YTQLASLVVSYLFEEGRLLSRQSIHQVDARWPRDQADLLYHYQDLGAEKQRYSRDGPGEFAPSDYVDKGRGQSDHIRPVDGRVGSQRSGRASHINHYVCLIIIKGAIEPGRTEKEGCDVQG